MFPTRYKILLATLLFTGSICHAADDHAAQMAQSLTLFKNEVRPVLVENCVRCHGGAQSSI